MRCIYTHEFMKDIPVLPIISNLVELQTLANMKSYASKLAR